MMSLIFNITIIVVMIIIMIIVVILMIMIIVIVIIIIIIIMWFNHSSCSLFAKDKVCPGRWVMIEGLPSG